MDGREVAPVLAGNPVLHIQFSGYHGPAPGGGGGGGACRDASSYQRVNRPPGQAGVVV